MQLIVYRETATAYYVGKLINEPPDWAETWMDGGIALEPFCIVEKHVKNTLHGHVDVQANLELILSIPELLAGAGKQQEEEA
jgi:hypothetical protein